jgi:hypothetical protein
VFGRYYVDELARMRKAWLDLYGNNPIAEDQRIQNYHGTPSNPGNAFKSYLFPELSAFSFDEEGNVTGDMPQAVKDLDIFNKSANNEPDFDTSLVEKLRPIIEKSLVELMESDFQKAINLGVIGKRPNNRGHYNISIDKSELKNNKENKNKEEVLRATMADFTINSLIANIETTKLFIGDPAFYKAHGDLQKRVPAIIAPGQDFMLSKDVPTTFNAAVAKDITINLKESNPEIWNNYMEALKDSGYTASEAETILDAYKEIDVADAQGYITLERYRDILKGIGKWREATMAKPFQDLMDGKKIDSSSKMFLQPLKGMYFANENHESGRIAPMYLKYSMAPLIPSVIKGTKLEKMLDKMTKNPDGSVKERSLQVDEMIFNSGVKAGASGQADINEIVSGEAEFKFKTLSNAYWKLQQDLTAKYFKKGKAIEGSQVIKNVLANIDMNEIYSDVKVETLDRINPETKEVTSERVVITPYVLDARTEDGKIIESKFEGDSIKDEAFRAGYSGYISEDGTYQYLGEPSRKEFTKVGDEMTINWGGEASSRMVIDSIEYSPESSIEFGEEYDLDEFDIERFNLTSNYKKGANIWKISGINVKSKKPYSFEVFENGDFYKMNNSETVGSGFFLDSFLGATPEDIKYEPLKPNLDGVRTGEDVARDFINIDKAISDLGSEEFDATYGLENIGTFGSTMKPHGPDGELSPLYQELIKKLEIDNAPEGVIEMLKKGFPLDSITQYRKKLQQTILSVLNKKTVKTDMPGGAFIQMSSALFDYLDSEGDIESDIIWLEKGTLKPPTYDKAKNKVKAGTILLPSTVIKDYKTANPNTKLTDLQIAKMAQEKGLLEGVGYRIPNQDMASSDYFEIAGILPEYMGDTVVVYPEITAKTGSDFDIDKMFVMLPTYQVKNGEFVVKGKQDDLKSRWIEYYMPGILAKHGKEIFENLDEANLLNSSLKAMLEEAKEDKDFLYIQNGPSAINSEEMAEVLERIDDLKDSFTSASIRGQVEEYLLKDVSEGVSDSIEDFGNRPEFKQYGKKALQNLKIQSYKEILLSPKTFSRLISPIDSSWAKDVVKEVRKAREKRSGSLEGKQLGLDYFSAGYQMDTKRAFMGGQNGVGQAANHLTDHVNTQIAKVGFRGFLGGGNYKDGITSFAGSKDEAGNLITSNVSAFLNAFVDIAKDPYIFDLNINTFTTNAALMLLRAGFDREFVTLFMSQPIIVDYANLSLENEGRTIKREYHKSGKNKGKIITPLDKTKELYVVAEGSESDKMFSINNLPNNDQLLDQIGTPNSEDQLAILELFRKYQDVGQQFAEQVSAFKFDTVGAGKTITDSIINQNKLTNALQNRSFTGVNRRLENSMQQSYIKNSNEKALQFMPSLFLGASEGTKAAIDMVALYLGSTKITNSDLATKIENDAYQYLMEDFPGFNHPNPKELFHGEKSVGKRTDFFKHNPLSTVKDNLFVKSLRTSVEGTLREAPKYPEHNIYSTEKGVGSALTNRTELAKSKGNIGKSYPVTINGKTYVDAEDAFKSLKDSNERITQPSKDDSKNYQLMVDIIVAKLQQHPILIQAIQQNGGIDWLASGKHQPPKKKEGGTIWESEGGNWFMQSLVEAYTWVTGEEFTMAFDDQMHFVKASQGKKTPTAKQTLTEEWKKLLNDPDEKVRDWAEDLIKYSFYATGMNPTAGSFYDFIPPSYMISKGIDNHVNMKMREMNEGASGRMINFPNLFFRNNADNSSIVPNLKLDEVKAATLSLGNKDYTLDKKDAVSIPSGSAPKRVLASRNYKIDGSYDIVFKPYININETLYKLQGYNDTVVDGKKSREAIYARETKLGYQGERNFLKEYGPEVKNSNYMTDQTSFNVNKSVGLTKYEPARDLDSSDYQAQNYSEFGLEASNITQEKLNTLSLAIPGAEVVFDSSITELAHVRQGENGPIITINPDKVAEDTVIHEYGHILIDSIGGVSNPFVKKGVEQLRNSKLWNAVAQSTGLSGVALQKEVLATAIGQEGAKVFDKQNAHKKPRFLQWLDNFFRRIKMKLGISKNVAKDLAKTLLSEQEILSSEKIRVDEKQFQKTSSEDLLTQGREEALNKIMEDIQKKLVSKEADRKRHTYTKDLNEAIKTGNQQEIQRWNNINKIASLKESVFKAMEEESVMKGLTIFVRQASNHNKGIATALRNHIKEGTLNIANLHNIKAYAATYDVMEDLTSLINTLTLGSNPLLTETMATSLKQALNEVMVDRRFISDTIKQVTPALLAQNNSHNYHRVQTSFRLKFEREFDLNNKGVKKDKSYYEKQSEFVNKLMSDNQEKISGMERDELKKSLTSANRDIGVIEMLFSDPRMISDALISTAVKEVDRADFKSMTAYIDYLRTAIPKYQAYVAKKGADKLVGGNDVAALNEKFIVETESGKLRMVTAKEIAKMESSGQINSEDLEYYEMISELLQKADDMLPADFKKSYKDKMFLPSLRKGNAERFMQDGLIPMMKEYGRDFVKLQRNDPHNIGIGKINNQVTEVEEIDPDTGDKVLRQVPVELLESEATPLIGVNGSTPNEAEIQMKVQEIRNNKKFIKGVNAAGEIVELDSGEEYVRYINTKTKKEYNRATSVIDNKPHKISRNKGESMEDFKSRATAFFDGQVTAGVMTKRDAEWERTGALRLASASELGNHVDNFVRDFFTGELKDLSTYTFAPQDDIQSFNQSLVDLKERLDSRGETVMSDDIVLFDETSGVAGTVDLMTYDKNGVFRIYDMKTQKGNKFKTSYGKDATAKNAMETGENGKVSRYYSTKYGKSDSQKHQEQLSLYRIMLNNTHGVRAKTVGIMPIELDYEPGDTSSKTLKMLGGKLHKAKDNVKHVAIQKFKGEENFKPSYTGANKYNKEFNSANEKFKEATVEVFSDENDQEAKLVPIYFRGDIDVKDQSKDLFSVAMANMYMALNYKNKIAIAPNLEMIQDAVNERNVAERDSKGSLKVVKKVWDKVVKKGDTSNLKRAFDSMLDNRLYGITQLDAGDVMGVNVNMAVKKLMGLTGDAALMLNYASSIVNLIQGHVATKIEAAGGRYFNSKDVRYAFGQYRKHLGGVITDIGRIDNTQQSKVNLVLDKFDMMGDFNGMAKDLSQNHKIQSFLRKERLHGFSGLAEHHIQGVLMISTLSAIKVFDKNNKPIMNEKGEQMNMWEAYSVKENSEGLNDLVLDPRVKNSTRNRTGKGFEKQDGITEAEFELSMFMKYLNADLNGNYDPKSQAMAQQYVIGQAAFMLKKWLPRGAASRYRGFTKSNDILANRIDQEGDNFMIDEDEYSEALRDRIQGRYTTLKNFANTVRKRVKDEGMKAVSSTWDDLDPLELANMQKNLYGACTTLFFFAGSSFLAALAADDDGEGSNKELFFLAYLMKRAQQEMTFWANPTDFMRTLGTPITALKTLSSLSDAVFGFLLGPFGGGWDTYKSGNNEGSWKWYVSMKKSIPYTDPTKQFSRDWEKSYNFLLNGPIR